MKNNEPICIIGGYDMLSNSYFNEIKKNRNNSIFINVSDLKISRRDFFNYKIFELKKIINTLETKKIKNIIFLGKVNRPNLSKFKADGVIEKYFPLLIDAYKKGDGNVLSLVIKIFSENGFFAISPLKISKKFFFLKNDFDKIISSEDKIDINKSINILNDLSKYDNAQSIVCSNGFIIAIEAAEGTDELLKRVKDIRKKLGTIDKKEGLLTKVPKKSQSKLIDLPVIGPKTMILVKKANLNGIAINPKLTMVYEKDKLLKFAKDNKIKIFDIS